MVLIFTQSCSFNEFENSNRIIDISNEIELLLLPDLNLPNQLKWVVSTKENRYCETAFIETQLINREQTQDLLIKGIISPSNCMVNDTRLIAIESFPLNERYVVDLEFANDLSSKIDLTFIDNTIIIDHENVDYFSFNQSSLKFSSNTQIWIGLDESNSPTTNEFTEFVENSLSLFELKTVGQGDYGYIYQEEELNYVVHPTNYTKHENFLAYEIPSDIDYHVFRDQLLDASISYRMQNPNFEFYIATNRGDLF